MSDEAYEKQVREYYDAGLRESHGEQWMKDNAKFLDAWWEIEESLIL